MDNQIVTTPYSNNPPPTEPQMVASGWVGVDLDGCLAKYDGFVSVDHIGEPVPAIQELVKAMIADGVDVRIFTARVAPATLIYNKTPEQAQEEIQKVVIAIAQWSFEHLGKMLPVTATKDFMMKFCIDDRSVQVEPNTGVILGRMLA